MGQRWTLANVMTTLNFESIDEAPVGENFKRPEIRGQRQVSQSEGAGVIIHAAAFADCAAQRSKPTWNWIGITIVRPKCGDLYPQPLETSAAYHQPNVLSGQRRKICSAPTGR